MTLGFLVTLFLEFSVILATWVIWSLEFWVTLETLEISFLVFLDSLDSLATEIGFQIKLSEIINVNLETSLSFWSFW